MSIKSWNFWKRSWPSEIPSGAEKDMESTWVDQIEMRDLQNVKERMKAVEETLCVLQEEVGHVEAEHCKKAKETH